MKNYPFILLQKIQIETDYLTKHPYFKPTFQISKHTDKQQRFLTIFNFQHSQIIQQEFEQLADPII